MKNEIKKINNKLVLETFYGPVTFNSYQDYLNYVKTQRTLKIERLNKDKKVA